MCLALLRLSWISFFSFIYGKRRQFRPPPLITAYQRKPLLCFVSLSALDGSCFTVIIMHFLVIFPVDKAVCFSSKSSIGTISLKGIFSNVLITVYKSGTLCLLMVIPPKVHSATLPHLSHWPRETNYQA